MENIKKLLSSRGIKPTYTRLLILKYLQATRNHPAADMIYREMVKIMPTISKTTVYNTLKIFQDEGIIIPVTITGTEARFDFNTCCHHHFLCERCGDIVDLDIVCPHFSRGGIQGHVIKELHGYFKGLCAGCNEKSKGRK